MNGAVIKYNAKKNNISHDIVNDKVIKLPKFKKDGTVKKTISNSKKDRDDKMPFKVEDVDKMINYFKERINSANTEFQEFTAFRNLALFVMGINVGIRCGDLLQLKWNKLYDKNWKMLEYAKITPEKTSKTNKKVLLAYNSAFTIIAEQYRKYINPKSTDEYIFVKSLDNKDFIKYSAVLKIIKDVAKEIGIDYPIGTHSMRKTFGRQRYEKSNNKGKTLIELMQLFRHEDLSTTLAYIGITIEEQIDLYNEVNLGLDLIGDIFTKRNNGLF